MWIDFSDLACDKAKAFGKLVRATFCTCAEEGTEMCM